MEMYNGFDIFGKNGTKISPAQLIYEKTDFVNSWLFMSSPVPVVSILVVYLLFVLKLGPSFMKDRQAYKLQTLIPIYNAVQVGISAFLLYLCAAMMSANGLVPKTCVMETEYNRRHITAVMHYYFLAKISELLDTIFFVLRKKSNQVTFLHVYHHTLMVAVTWIALKYEPTYTVLFLGLLNSTVHVVMYTYYGLSSVPSLTKYLWWKKYITSMQLIQFALILIHFGIAFMVSECSPSYTMTIAMAINGTLFLYLFGNFYVNTYNKKTNKDTQFKNGTNKTDIKNKTFENGMKYGKGKTNADSQYTSASITVNDTYRIRFNLGKKAT
ncbi:elongation of very long chain fatty acids protein 7-like isoform X1 [Helicoverpa zea]|uniref:elongation of very long chain fatty acids protein 7-like isoform X1 n=1 Tax=Helicoverpa zea TaxID=7113 RepID=UPI001F573EBB|nr:elongation of very long chain fatty acids protein 7-like isoform X1 [Helicoverpa zea]